MIKKILFIIVLFTLIFGISFTIYIFINSKTTKPNDNVVSNGFFPSLQQIKETIFDTNPKIQDIVNTIDLNQNTYTQFRKVQDNVLAFTSTKDDLVIFIDKKTGNIFSLNPNTLEKKRLSNNTFLNITRPSLNVYDDNLLIVSFIDKTNTNILQYIDLNSSSTSTLNKTTKVPITTSYTAMNPTKKSSILLESRDGNNYLLKYNFNDGTQNYVGKENYSDWNIKFLSQNKISLQTKPSYLYPGYLYLIDLNKLAKEKIIGNVFGLNGLVSPDGKKVIYSKNDSTGVLSTILYDVEKNKNTILDIKTFPNEKCVWTKDNLTIFCLAPKTFPTKFYMDNWYKGLQSFSDNIYSVDVEGIKVFTETTKNTGRDFINVELNKSEGSLLMLDKENKLWVYDIYSYDSSI